jgi:hypothetical protein
MPSFLPSELLVEGGQGRTTIGAHCRDLYHGVVGVSVRVHVFDGNVVTRMPVGHKELRVIEGGLA